MKVARIVRSKYAMPVLALTLINLLFILGYLIPGYLPLGPFGKPNPAAVFLPIIVDLFAVVFWFRSYLLLITRKIFCSTGAIRVHAAEPIATFDPLDYMKFNTIDNLSPHAMNALCDLVWEKHGRDTEIMDYHLEELLMPIIRNFRDIEYMKYLGEEYYDHGVHGIMIQEYREDGGSTFLGRRGGKASGNAVMVNPAGMVRPYGPNSICYTTVENYWGLDLFGYEMYDEENPGETIKYYGVPHYILAGVLDHNPYFKLGDHMIVYGTEPLPQCVRALVEDNEKVVENELHKRPRWIWTFAAKVEDINSDARINYIKHEIKEVGKSIKKLSDNFEVVKKTEERITDKESEEPEEPEAAESNGGEEE